MRRVSFAADGYSDYEPGLLLRVPQVQSGLARPLGRGQVDTTEGEAMTQGDTSTSITSHDRARRVVSRQTEGSVWLRYVPRPTRADKSVRTDIGSQKMKETP